jgi:hypothetical protein
VPFVVERGAHVILEVPRPLHQLCSTLSGSGLIVSKGDPLPDFDTHCPLLSLPLAFGTRLETIPSVTPYLHASPDAVAHWNARLVPQTRPRIGLAWSGSRAHKKDHNRSIELGALLIVKTAHGTRRPVCFGRTRHANGTMSLCAFAPPCRTSWHGLAWQKARQANAHTR